MRKTTLIFFVVILTAPLALCAYDASGEGSGDLEDCYFPNPSPNDMQGGTVSETAGCVKLPPAEKYNYISWMHHIPGIKLVYEFRAAGSKPGNILTSCNTKSLEDEWASCITDPVPGTGGIYACFKSLGGDPWLWTGPNTAQYFFLHSDGNFYHHPYVFPAVKVCYSPAEPGPEPGPGPSTEAPPAVGRTITFYASCWNGEEHDPIYGMATREVGHELKSMLSSPVTITEVCEPVFPLTGYDEATEDIAFGLELAAYNNVYFPEDRPQFADSLLQHFERYSPQEVDVLCPSHGGPPMILEAQNFLCNNYGQRAYFQLKFDPNDPKKIAELLKNTFLSLSGAETPTSPPTPAPENEKPKPAFTYTPPNPAVNEPIIFDASSSTDPDGTIEEYKWGFGDGAFEEQSNVKTTHTYSGPGEYEVTLTVTDDYGESASLMKKVSVRQITSNRPPKADFFFDPSSPEVGENVHFTDRSTDPDGEDDLDSWQWDFGDGESSTSQNPTHSYSDTGSYDVILTVSDSAGNEDSATKTVNVVSLQKKKLGDSCSSHEECITGYCNPDYNLCADPACGIAPDVGYPGEEFTSAEDWIGATCWNPPQVILGGGNQPVQARKICTFTFEEAFDICHPNIQTLASRIIKESMTDRSQPDWEIKELRTRQEKVLQRARTIQYWFGEGCCLFGTTPNSPDVSSYCRGNPAGTCFDITSGTFSCDGEFECEPDDCPVTKYDPSKPVNFCGGEFPASATQQLGFGVCHDNSIFVTTLMRAVGTKPEDIYFMTGPYHAYNLLRFADEREYKIVDTTNGATVMDGGGWFYYAGQRCPPSCRDSIKGTYEAPCPFCYCYLVQNPSYGRQKCYFANDKGRRECFRPEEIRGC